MLNQQCAILTVIDSYIEPLLNRVLTTDKLGICCEAIKVDSMSSSCGKFQGDRFKLSIPYAKQNLTWNVFFDSQCPEMGPDFIFNDNTFLADMDVDTLSVKVPSLAKWNPNDGNALLNVLMELLSCYKQHQIQLLQKQSRLQLEYNMLMESTEIKPEDVEIILLPCSSKPVEARFLISLSVDLSQLQIRTCKSESDVAILLIIFSGADWSRITPQLDISKSLEKIFSGTVLLQVNSIVQSLEKRREYITTFLALKRKACIEFDTINCNYVTCLLTDDGFSTVLHIQLPLGFPQEPPMIELHSIYHMTSQHIFYSEKVKSYPYNNTWSSKIMILKLFKYINNIIKKFKLNSIKNCS
ncbi:BRCA1-A complex subunit BRE, partial [Eufriesea mexicana]